MWLCCLFSLRVRRGGVAETWRVLGPEQHHLAGVSTAESKAACPVPAADQEQHGLRPPVWPGVSRWCAAALLLQQVASHQGHHPWLQVRRRALLNTSDKFLQIWFYFCSSHGFEMGEAQFGSNMSWWKVCVCRRRFRTKKENWMDWKLF